MSKLSLDYTTLKQTHTVDFPRLDGGLNLWELDYRMDNNQSPKMRNLWWQDGVLQARDGQTDIWKTKLDARCYTCYPELFHGYVIMHIGPYLLAKTPEESMEFVSATQIARDVPEVRGTFIEWQNKLYYKTAGAFIRITWNGSAIQTSNVADSAVVPVTQINSNPSTGAGDLYQPKNRLSRQREVQYNAWNESVTVTKTGDGTTKAFTLGYTSSTANQLVGIDKVYIGNALQGTSAYSVNLSTGTLTFVNSPASGTEIAIYCLIGGKVYQLPEKGVAAIKTVKVNGTATTAYTANLAAGTVTFSSAPAVTFPPTNNTVSITYEMADTDTINAYNAIMSCRYGAVYGGEQNLCMVIGGCEAQKNAFFWNANDAYNMNDSYWPMTNYNLAGDSNDSVTGFGRQYNELIVFSQRSVGKAGYSVEDINGRASISLTYQAINSKIGCDLPWSIQLIENNLVFCNRAGGVYIVRDSSAAYENNIVGISKNVNGTPSRDGLVADVRKANDEDLVCSCDDGQRYWVVVNGHAYLWDYDVSSAGKPSWFFFTNIHAVQFFKTDDFLHHMDGEGRMTKMSRTFFDYGQAIDKVYQFPTQFFGGYERLKDVNDCLFSIRSDTDSEIEILYQTDYEDRKDRTNILNLSWRLVPRNLAYRCLRVGRYATVAKRKPGCRHIRHFSMTLSNNVAGQDIAIASAQIHYRFQGKER